jgi:hypothetical protein
MASTDSAGMWLRLSKARILAESSEKENGFARNIRKPFTAEQVKEHVVPLLENEK